MSTKFKFVEGLYTDKYGKCLCNVPLVQHIHGRVFHRCFEMKESIDKFISRWEDDFYPRFSAGVDALAKKHSKLRMIEVHLWVNYAIDDTFGNSVIR